MKPNIAVGLKPWEWKFLSEYASLGFRDATKALQSVKPEMSLFAAGRASYRCLNRPAVSEQVELLKKEISGQHRDAIRSTREALNSRFLRIADEQVGKTLKVITREGSIAEIEDPKAPDREMRALEDISKLNGYGLQETGDTNSGNYVTLVQNLMLNVTNVKEGDNPMMDLLEEVIDVEE